MPDASVSVPLTCGLVIRSPAGWLLAHRTRTAWWDLPKGKQELGESPVQTAMRECREEIGLDLSAYAQRCIDLGAAPYNLRRGRVLHLFVLELPDRLSLESCHCRSWVQRQGETVPEMDDFAWIAPDRLPLYLKRRMWRHLVARDLLPACQALEV